MADAAAARRRRIKGRALQTKKKATGPDEAFEHVYASLLLCFIFVSFRFAFLSVTRPTPLPGKREVIQMKGERRKRKREKGTATQFDSYMTRYFLGVRHLFHCYAYTRRPLAYGSENGCY